jgi:hypothetical protein
MYYGSLTAQAVSDFQAKYSADVLAPLGLNSPTGYWGSSSRSKARELCASDNVSDDESADEDESTDESDESADEDEDMDEEDEENLEGGEASLESYDLRSGDDNDIAEGDSGEIADVEFDVEDGDVSVRRVDVGLGYSSSTSDDGDEEPWDVFDELMLMKDGDEVASVQVDDESDWLDDDTNFDDMDNGDGQEFYEVRMSGLSDVVREGETAEYTIEASVQSNVDDAGNQPEWNVAIDDEGVRARDGEGIDQYTGDNEDTNSFQVEEEGQGEELSVSSSSDDPDEAILQVEDRDTSDDFGVFAFDVEAEENDIALDTADVNVDFTGEVSTSSSDDATYDDVVNDAYLEIDGEQFDVDGTDGDDSDPDSSDDRSTSTLTFDVDEEFTVEEDEEVTATLFLELNQQNGNYEEGVTVQGSIDDEAIDAEGADDVKSDGSATGDAHTVLVSGVYSEDPADITTNRTENYIQYEFEVDLTAFEDDAYLNATSSASDINTVDDETGGEVPFHYTIENENGTTTTYDVVSTADETNNNNFVVYEGDTETFTVTVEYDSADKSSYRMILDQARFNTDDSRSWSGEYDFTPEDEYRSGLVSEASNSS